MNNEKGADTDEVVVLVDEADCVIGTADKYKVHSTNTPLHRGFSVFLFNNNCEILLQRRAYSKKTWPGVWSNSCCGHPALDESPAAAAHRRLEFELGVSGVDLKLILPDFRYRAEKDGVVENEICPVFVGVANVQIRPNPDEVHEVKWTVWSEFCVEAASPNTGISPWAVEEVSELVKNSDFQTFLEELG